MCEQQGLVVFRPPVWLKDQAASYQPTLDIESQMEFVIDVAARNIAERTGGPFGAAVFEQDSGRLVSLGVNLVTTQKLSILHAEIVALSTAQRRVGAFDLGAPDLASHQLVTSTEPCAMCFGAIPWSGVRKVVTGASDSDAREVGFDEGPKVADWVGALESRGIVVTTDVLRDRAREVLIAYRDSGGEIYNSRADRETS